MLTLLALLAVSDARAETGQKWALVVGVDRYKDSAGVSGPSSADADSRAIAKALVEAEGFPAENVRLLVSDADPSRDSEAKPERNTILRELASLAKKVHTGDTVFVYFSGHGIEKNGTSYLLPYDTDAFDDEAIADAGIDLPKFRDRLREVPAGLLILAFDAFRNSPLKGSGDAGPAGNALTATQIRRLDFDGISATSDKTATNAGGPRAVVTLFSCGLGEKSYEWPGKGRGFFAYYLEQGLRGVKEATAADGTVHVDTLTHYLATTVPRAVEQSEGKPQTPLIEFRGAVEAGQIALNAPALPAAAPSVPDAKAATVLATDRHGYIRVSLSPPNAAVFVDGERAYPIGGRVAVDLKGADSKTVEVGVTANGYQTRVESITIAHGTVVPLNVELAANASPVTAAVTTVTTVTTVTPAAKLSVTTAAPVAAVPVLLAAPVLRLTLRHTDRVNTAAFSPDGKYILTGGADKAVRVWDAATGKTLQTLGGDTTPTLSASYSPDGQRILSGSYDHSAKVWDANSGQRLLAFKPLPGGIWTSSFSPDGKFIALGCTNNEATLWNAATGDNIGAFTGHTGAVWAVSFSSDGRRLVTASEDSTARIWDVDSKQTVLVLTGHDGPVYAAAFSPDGRSIVTGSADGTAKIWDAATGKVLHTLVGHGSFVEAAAFSPDNRYVITGGADATARLWNAATGQELRVLRGHEGNLSAVRFSPDGDSIVTAGTDGTVRVWTVAARPTTKQ